MGGKKKYIEMFSSFTEPFILLQIYIFCYFLVQEDISVLNMATGSSSWWKRNGHGCHADVVFTNVTTVQPSSPTPHTVAATSSFFGTTIVGCIIGYEYVEVLHSGLQCVLVVSSVDVGQSFLIYIG